MWSIAPALLHASWKTLSISWVKSRQRMWKEIIMIWILLMTTNLQYGRTARKLFHPPKILIFYKYFSPEWTWLFCLQCIFNEYYSCFPFLKLFVKSVKFFTLFCQKRSFWKKVWLAVPVCRQYWRRKLPFITDESSGARENRKKLALQELICFI